ncbi:DUF2269 domain-containing protein [Micromonospora sp. CPCC 206061]|uniref:DUF2269 domain-containing protein n=1 Tax=Micromonospora sp. CPCC 206061 TaxID=3122410 RepID=UPI002FF2C10D
MLTVHVTTSVGWLGAVAVFLVLGVVGMTSRDAAIVRAAYLVMEPTAWFVLIPLSFASLLTGLIQSLGTAWGLVRHYWVLFKLVINGGAVVVLLMYTRTLASLADAAARPEFSSDDLGAMRVSPTIHSGLALILLLAATVLAVYKPRGVTPYGHRKQRERQMPARRSGRSALAQP